MTRKTTSQFLEEMHQELLQKVNQILTIARLTNQEAKQRRHIYEITHRKNQTSDLEKIVTPAN